MQVDFPTEASCLQCSLSIIAPAKMTHREIESDFFFFNSPVWPFSHFSLVPRCQPVTFCPPIISPIYQHTPTFHSKNLVLKLTEVTERIDIQTLSFSSSSAIFDISLTCQVFKYDPFYTFLRKILLFAPKMSRIKFSLFCLQAAGCTWFESQILESFEFCLAAVLLCDLVYRRD